MPAPINPSNTNRQVFPYVRSLIAENTGLREIRAMVENRFPDYRTKGAKLAFHIDQACLEYLFPRMNDRQILEYMHGSNGSERPSAWTLEKIMARRVRWNSYCREHETRTIPSLSNPDVAPSVNEALIPETRTIPRAPVDVLASMPSAVAPNIPTRQTPFDKRRTFGCEIEFLFPININIEHIARKCRDAGVDCRVESYNHQTRTWWKIVTDASVQAKNSHQRERFVGGHEIVSPVLHGDEGMLELEKVCKVLNDCGVIVNDSCGGHVHIGLRPVNKSDKVAVTRNCIKLYSAYQNMFNSIMPKPRSHCQHAEVFSNYNMDKVQNDIDLDYFRRNDSRYFVVNPCSVDRHGTIEYRQHSSTTDHIKVGNWIKLMIRITERAEELHKKNKDVFSVRLKPDFYEEFKVCGELKAYVEKRKARFAAAANHPH